MIKLAKWLYDLGFKNGWDSAVESVNKGHSIISTGEGEQMKRDDEMFRRLAGGKPVNKKKGDNDD